jgi:tRNA/rRNA methyltransferase/tRNA (cytidine32/uridine32-2'-O)-methyltransferase
MQLSDFVVILSRVSEPGNAGAVCRAMKNMGLSRLRLVAPPPLDETRVRARAVHAVNIWDNAERFDTLAEAAMDCSLLIGTTRRRGRHRKGVTMDPRTLAAWLRERGREQDPDSGGPEADLKALPGHAGPIGLVFGNERTGLEDSELDLCNIASHIPVSDAFPSLNLSHAVQIYVYELFLAFGGRQAWRPASFEAERSAEAAERRLAPFETAPAPVKGDWTPLNRAQVEELTTSITGTLADLGFYQHPGREEQYRFLRDLVSRAGLGESEGRYLANIFAKAGRLGRFR